MIYPNSAVGAGLVSARFGESPTVLWVPTRGTPTMAMMKTNPFGYNRPEMGKVLDEFLIDVRTSFFYSMAQISAQFCGIFHSLFTIWMDVLVLQVRCLSLLHAPYHTWAEPRYSKRDSTVHSVVIDSILQAFTSFPALWYRTSPEFVGLHHQPFKDFAR